VGVPGLLSDGRSPLRRGLRALGCPGPSGRAEDRGTRRVRGGYGHTDALRPALPEPGGVSVFHFPCAGPRARGPLRRLRRAWPPGIPTGTHRLRRPPRRRGVRLPVLPVPLARPEPVAFGLAAVEAGTAPPDAARLPRGAGTGHRV